MSTLVISAAKVKELTGRSKNVEDRKFTPAIKRAMLELRDGFGVTGYNILIAAITSDPDLSGNANLKTLRDDYIWPWMAWRVIELATVATFAESERNGTYTRSGEDYTAADGRTLGMMKADAADYASTYMAELYAYLDDNATTYTWYTVDGVEEDKARETNTGGIITRIDRWQRPYGERYPVDGYPDDCCDGY